MRLFRWLAVLLLPLLGGCAALEYYGHLINGQADLLNRARPVAEVLSDPAQPEAVRAALAELARARRFAVTALALPDNGSYRDYADLERPYAVWNVIAAPRFSVEAKRWCFPVTGCIPYRGWFDEARARQQAADLRTQGYDVYVAGARAYSTLGWFADPLLNTMLLPDPARRAELLFHEMAHQKLFVADDGAFNEAFATFVAQIGTLRWLQAQGADGETIAAYRRHLARRVGFMALLRRTRERLAAIYASGESRAQMARAKRAAFDRLRAEYASWKRDTGSDEWDGWMARELNNAHLALVGTYHDLVPAFARLLEGCGDDLGCFYRRCEALAKMPQAERRRCLEAAASCRGWIETTEVTEDAEDVGRDPDRG